MYQIKLSIQINNTSPFAIRTNAEWNGETEKERRMPVPGLDTKLIATVVRLSVHFLSYLTTKELPVSGYHRRRRVPRLTGVILAPTVP